MRLPRSISPSSTLILIAFLANTVCREGKASPSPSPRPRSAQETVDDSSCPSGGKDSPNNQQATKETPAPHDNRGGYLKKMTYDVGLNEEQSLVYIDMVDTTSEEEEFPPDGRRLCKMYNLSPLKLHLIRKEDTSGTFEMIDVMHPVSTTGVTCTVGDHYIWLDRKNPQNPTHEVWIPDDDTRHFVFEQPYEELGTNQERERYIRYKRGLMYEQYYRRATGRSYLGGSYPPRPPPQHPFWPADYIGQEHLVELDGKNRSLLVFSTAPRILVLDNFLSAQEIDTIQAMADEKGFSESTTLSINDRKLQRRTSETSWLGRNQHPVLKGIYSRAAQLLRIPNLSDCCAEDLQVVHYEQGQEYRAHFDFKLPGGWSEPVRFATLLVYLTDCPAGGETLFPLAVGGPLGFQPMAGAALLFYSVLPDGNLDERSLHASTPVEKGQST